MDYAGKVLYLRHQNRWTQKECGDRFPEHDVDQWQISRWERGESPSLKRREQIDTLCYATMESSFQGFRYICNLGKRYGHRYQEREGDALERLRRALLTTPLSPPTGCLAVIALHADLAKGVRAQCFCSGEDPPRTYFVLVRDDAHWRENVRDEVFAHVLPFELSTKLTVTND